MSGAARSTGAVPCRDPKIERDQNNPVIVAIECSEEAGSEIFPAGRRETLDRKFIRHDPIHAFFAGARARC
jgi:hypothetical protein